MNRGGRGGRGRGRGVTGPRAQARDDDGNVVETKVEGPPPIYPVSSTSPDDVLCRIIDSVIPSEYPHCLPTFLTKTPQTLSRRWNSLARSIAIKCQTMMNYVRISAHGNLDGATNPALLFIAAA